MSKIVQITFTDEQYSKLESLARDQKIQHYIIKQLFPINDFELWYPKLLSQVQKAPKGMEFSIKLALGMDWGNIPKGTRLSLGRVFYQQVAAQKIPEVIAMEQDSAKTQWYQKI